MGRSGGGFGGGGGMRGGGSGGGFSARSSSFGISRGARGSSSYNRSPSGNVSRSSGFGSSARGNPLRNPPITMKGVDHGSFIYGGRTHIIRHYHGYGYGYRYRPYWWGPYYFYPVIPYHDTYLPLPPQYDPFQRFLSILIGITVTCLIIYLVCALLVSVSYLQFDAVSYHVGKKEIPFVLILIGSLLGIGTISKYAYQYNRRTQCTMAGGKFSRGTCHLP